MSVSGQVMRESIAKSGKALVGTIRAHWRISLAYILLILFYSQVVHDARQVELTSLGLVFPAWIPHIMFRSILDLMGVILFAKIVEIASHRGVRAVLVGLGAVGSALSVYFMDHPLAGDNWPPVLGALLTAISTFYLACVLLQTGCRLGVAANLRCIACAALMALPMAPLFLVLPQIVLNYATPFLPLAVYVLLVSSSRGVERIRRKSSTTTEGLFVPARFLITCLVDGMVFGLFTSISGWSANFIVSVAVAAAISSVVLVYLIAVRNITYNDILFRIEFPLGALGLLLMLPLGTDSPIPSLLFLTTFVMRYTTVFTLNIYHVSRYDLPLVWVGGYTDFARNFGQVIGFTIPVLFLTGSGVEPSPMRVATLGAIVCLVACVYLQSEANDRTGWGHSRVYSEEEPLSGTELACKRIASEFALSNREADVLPLLASGNSHKRVAEQLYISAETVKTHAHSIYRKLDVHSKQELIDFVRTKANEKR